jgi:hypothetical protein
MEGESIENKRENAQCGSSRFKVGVKKRIKNQKHKNLEFNLTQYAGFRELLT